MVSSENSDIPSIDRDTHAENSLQGYPISSIEKLKHTIPNPFNHRIFITLLSLFTGFFTGVSGIVLIFFGKGLTSLGISWDLIATSFLGLRESEWLVMHVIFGLLFTISGFVHFRFNWRRFKAYFMRFNHARIKRMIVSSIIVASFLIGAMTGLIYYIGHGIKELPVDYSGIFTPVVDDVHTEAWTNLTPLLPSSPLLDIIAQGHGGGEGGSGRGTYALLSTLHTLFSLLFFAAGFLHLILNWLPLKTYLTQRKKGTPTSKNKTKSDSAPPNSPPDTPLDTPLNTPLDTPLDTPTPLPKKGSLRYRRELWLSGGLTVVALLSSILFLPPLSWLIIMVQS